METRTPRFTIVTANVNGIRAAARRGGLDWLAAVGADVITLQEVRATSDQVHAELAASPLASWHVAHSACSVLGRNGVTILSPMPFLRVSESLAAREFSGAGRWIEVEVATPWGPLTVASTYVHTGDADDPTRQAEKMRFLASVDRRMRRWRRAGVEAIVTGDLNVAHTEHDIKNWRGNRGRAGFLLEERQYLDRWARAGWVDLGRSLGGDGPGPYTWWSWRGRGFDTDGGWRIDYQISTPDIASRATTAEVGKAAAYAERWSDHAPLTVRFS